MLAAVEELLSIGEFSRRCGLSHRRLRAYAADGVLVPAAVDAATGYRYYAPSQVDEARLIDALRSAGMPLAVVARVVRSRSMAELDGWAEDFEGEVAGRRDALAGARRLLAATEGTGPRPRRSDMTVMTTAARTETGRVRTTNEDAMVVRDDLVVVADGMGGTPGGDVASSLAVSVVDAAYRDRSADALGAAVRAANRAVFERAVAEPRLRGMGSTVCALAVLGQAQVVVASVGDSRALLLRDGGVVPLTDDHSVTAELVRRGDLDPAAAAAHPQRHVLTRALGVAPDVEVDLRVEELRAGDRLVVCTDGMWHDVDDDLLVRLVGVATPTAAVDALVEQALAAGGADNITVVVVDVDLDVEVMIGA